MMWNNVVEAVYRTSQHNASELKLSSEELIKTALVKGKAKLKSV